MTNGTELTPSKQQDWDFDIVNQLSLFDDEKLDRLDIEWLTYNALREGIGLSLRGLRFAGHRDMIRLAQRVAPELFATSESLLVREWESPEEREVREISIARGVSFEVAVDTEIKRLEMIIEGYTDKEDKLATLNRRLNRLRTIKSERTLKEYYEGKLIERDARIGYGKPEDKRSDNYFDFSLPAGRFMRIRVTHGTKIEDINGADLIYEHHASDSGRVRIAAIQYKILLEGRYVKKSRQLKSQLSRLENCFCKKAPCKSEEPEDHKFYRLPTCTAFLRPTHRLQSTNSSILSRGYYLPICVVQTLWRKRCEISEYSVDKQVVRDAMFENLFNANLLGSRWLTVEELDSIYKAQGILESYETSMIHIKCYEQQNKSISFSP